TERRTIRSIIIVQEDRLARTCPQAPTTRDDRFHDECGVFGVYHHPEAAHLTYLGLHGLQHRGQESAGIVSSSGDRLHEEKGMGQDRKHTSELQSRSDLVCRLLLE